MVGVSGEQHLPAWRRRTRGETRWPVTAAILIVATLQWITPPDLAFDPRWLLPSVEVAFLVALLVANPFRMDRESSVLRLLSLGLVAVATLATFWSAGRLVLLVIRGGGHQEPSEVLLSGAVIWLTNVFVFAVWYWELDRGGPAARATARKIHPDFLFAQMSVPELTPKDWEPKFVDYLYLAFTNAAAFSPTDTLPLSRWAKLAMMAQAAVSITVVALVIARAVNILA
jgi:uncharacterized membrane protein